MLTRPLVLAAAAAALPFSNALAQDATPTPAPYASDERALFTTPASVADPVGADAAMLFNPAGLALDEGGEFVLLHSDRFDDDLPGDGDAFFWKTGGPFHFGAEWARPAENVDLNLFHFGSTMELGRATAMGATYVSNLGLGDVRYDNWSAGFLSRPTRYFALGGTVWNAQEDHQPGLDLRARYGGGLAIRPFANDRVTLAADVAKTDGQKGEDFRYSVRLRPVNGVSIFATSDEHDRWTAGLGLSFTYGDVGGHAFSDTEGDAIGMTSRIAFRERRAEPLIQGGRTYARIGVGGALPDRSEESFFTDAETTLPDILQTLADVRRDPTIDGVLVRLDGFGGGLATAQEIRNGILATRAAKKKVLCYFDAADLRTYYVAAACDRIAMNPAGIVAIEGISSNQAYMKGTLDKAGVQVEVARVGEYKGAPEPYIQTEPSKESLEVINALLDGIFSQSIDGIAAGRGLDPSQVKALVDGAFYTPEKALEAKLVDYVFYPDELEEKAKDFLGKSFSVLRGYQGVKPANTEWGAPPRIAIVYASGAITEGESQEAGPFSDPVLGSRTIVRALRDAKGDDAVKAVVLRVDSPGGSGFASDEIWHEVLAVKKVKPVVVSMGDVAASGGYYVSMGSNEIFALPGTITGSIGVFFLKPNFQKLYEKLEYKRYDYSRGAYAEMFTEARPFTEQERVMADRIVGDFYKDFIKKAAEGRATTPEAIDAVGRGHVWIGTKALDVKLVDKLGGLEDAIARAKELAKISKRRRVELVELPAERSWFEDLGKSGSSPELRNALARLPLAEELRQAALADAIGPGVAAWEPMRFDSWRQTREARQRHLREKQRIFWPLPASWEAWARGTAGRVE